MEQSFPKLKFTPSVRLLKLIAFDEFKFSRLVTFDGNWFYRKYLKSKNNIQGVYKLAETAVIESCLLPI